MENKTAVEWLFDRIIEEWGLEIEERDIAILEQAKEMEQRQMRDSYEDGAYSIKNIIKKRLIDKL